jgi:hypothetical protein
MMAGSAIQSGLTDTDEYRRRYEGLPAIDAVLGDDKDDWQITTALKDAGYRGLGVMEDLGNTLMNPGRLFGGDEAQAQAIQASDLGQPEPEIPNVAAQKADPAADPTKTTAAPAPAQSAIPADQEAGPTQWANQPITNPADMPTYTTQDWIAYRASSVGNMVMRGASPDEAHERITAMQHRGFMNHGLQALTLLASGDAYPAS